MEKIKQNHFDYWRINVTHLMIVHLNHMNLLLHPEKAIVLEQLELFTKKFIQNNNERRLSDTTYIIPVVVHVIHDYGDERISLTQVQSAINSMNDDFNLNNDDLIDSNGEFVPSVAFNWS